MPIPALIVALILILGLLLPPVAHGGQYEVHSCRLPDGAPMAAVGWAGTYGGGHWLQSDDTCVRGGALVAGLTGRSGYEHPQGAYSRWRFTAPEGTTIRRLRGHFSFATAPGQAYGSPVVEAEGDEGQGRFGIGPGAARGSPAAWNAPGNAYDSGAISPTSGFRVGTVCAGGRATCPYQGSETAQAHIFRTQVTLEDLGDPQAVRTSGRLLEPGVHSGIEHLHLEATDAGAGVYRLIVELDGAEVLRQVVDGNAGQCGDAWAGGSDYDFTVPVPCKHAVDGGETLDTRLLPDGSHRLRLLVEDAAGNRRVAAGPIEDWEVRNAPAPAPAVEGPVLPDANGVPATLRARIAVAFVAPRLVRRCARSLDANGRVRRRCRGVRRGSRLRRGRRLTARYRRGVRVAGRLTTVRGRPIAGAILEVRRRRRGSRAVERSLVRTRPNGRFAVKLGRAPSERIRVVYQRWPDAPTVRSRTLVRLTPTLVAVTVRPRTSVVGRRVTLRGRLRGGLRPRSGVAVVGEVRLSSGWVVFAERRVRRSARFRMSGRFRSPGRYALRARVLRTRGYPFEPARSRAVRIVVR